ncbi:MAG: 4-hydroxy-tetrahydrodipicolinate reductase [Proteobacteria bacterium]|nr:4-hydroxy-tetrahydrodipicolinate reductase [Pseudomonadota bacterium]MBS0463268.1 4-hydroxy-tetrahydrodipicolinate reductase [Pseudomonadota bacterium]
MVAPPPIRLLVHGASGRMGRALLRLVAVDPRFELAGAITRAGGMVDGVRCLPAARIAAALPFDALVDFSLPAAFDTALEVCLQRGIALVSGTTGLSPAQCKALALAAQSIPLVCAANFSLGVAVLHELVARAAAALPNWDCHLLETHHVRKLDAPSGTALALGQTIAAARGQAPHYLSLRAGDVVGEHHVQFTGAGERLELIHRATDRDIFARGALEAAARVAGRAPGLYALGKLLLG